MNCFLYFLFWAGANQIWLNNRRPHPRRPMPHAPWTAGLVGRGQPDPPRVYGWMDGCMHVEVEVNEGVNSVWRIK